MRACTAGCAIDKSQHSLTCRLLVTALLQTEFEGMRHPVKDHPPIATRERILAAAIARFSQSSYEQTGLRDIAADVDVDVAYVHRCFGSKERLFTEAVAATLQSRRYLAAIGDGVAAALSKRALSRGAAGARDVPAPDILMRSLLSPAARPVLRKYMAEEFIAPLSARLGQQAEVQAAMVAAVLVGFGILRNVLELDVLLEPEGGRLDSLLTHTIQSVITAGAPAKPRRKRER